jgi:hypothetical protein
MTPNPNPTRTDKGGMNITTETKKLQDIKNISLSNYGESGFVRVKLDDTFQACFHTFSDGRGSIRITSPYSEGDLHRYSVPANRMVTLLAYAIKHPEAFMSACEAFLSHS